MMISDGIYIKKMGERIRKVRQSKNMSLEKLSKVIGITADHIGDIETKRVNTSILTLKKIADALKVDVKKFL